MIVQPVIQTLTEPRLLDLALLDAQTSLTTGLSWLNYAFGRTEIQIDKDGDAYPAIYEGNNEYKNVFADSHLGNYCYFEIEDPQTIEGRAFSPMSSKYEANFTLHFWFDYREVYPVDHETKTIENVKYDILQVIGGMRLSSSDLSVDEVSSRLFDRVGNITRNKDITKKNNQYAKRPFGGLNIKGSLKYWQKCP